MRGVAGSWKDLTDSVSGLCGNLTDEVRNIGRVRSGGAGGVLSRASPGDVRGELVKRLPAVWRPAGAQEVRWDGTDEVDRRAPAGVYFWRLRAEGGTALTGRMVRVE